MSIEVMELVRDAIEQGIDLNMIGAKQILDKAIAEAKQEPKRKPLTWQRLQEIWYATPSEDAWIDRVWEFARGVEAEHGIKGGA